MSFSMCLITVSFAVYVVSTKMDKSWGRALLLVMVSTGMIRTSTFTGPNRAGEVTRFYPVVAMAVIVVLIVVRTYEFIARKPLFRDLNSEPT
jgi:hypothetical protein